MVKPSGSSGTYKIFKVFLGSKGFVHRDLAARNLLLTKENIVKIADFGLCRLTDEDLYIAQQNRKLPVKWMAPESLSKAEFSAMSDVYVASLMLT